MTLHVPFFCSSSLPLYSRIQTPCAFSSLFDDNQSPCWTPIHGFGLTQKHSKKHLRKRHRLPSLKKAKHIAIDEIYQGKKEGYQMIVIDFFKGSVIYTAAGKKAVLTLFRNDESVQMRILRRLQPIWAWLMSALSKRICLMQCWLSIIFML